MFPLDIKECEELRKVLSQERKQREKEIRLEDEEWEEKEDECRKLQRALSKAREESERNSKLAADWGLFWKQKDQEFQELQRALFKAREESERNCKHVDERELIWKNFYQGRKQAYQENIQEALDTSCSLGKELDRMRLFHDKVVAEHSEEYREIGRAHV
jgi:hypothetical protein